MKMVLYKTMRHFFPSFQKWLRRMDDPRNKKSTDHTLPSLMWTGILLFLLKVESRRQINFQFTGEQFVKNISLLAGENIEEIAHDQTLEYILERLDPEIISRLRTKMVNRLIRMKCFVDYRVNGYYAIAIDGTGFLTFKKRHCDHCLKKTKDGKVLYYYHPVVEAKMVFSNGMAISVGTEFVENANKNDTKQDCELKACYRLAEKLKRSFPQLRICLLLDALYANKSVFEICDRNKWKYLITFKKGSMPATYKEYISLKEHHQDCRERYEDKNLRQEYQWVKDIAYEEHLLNVLECRETKNDKAKKFVWITNFDVNKWNCRCLANEGGRLRWKIENEGFNTQKNGGYNLEHPYSKHPTAMKNFYLLLQIAHTINQLMEKGNLLMTEVNKAFGSIKNFTRRILESLRTSVFDSSEIHFVKSSCFQIRFRGP